MKIRLFSFVVVMPAVAALITAIALHHYRLNYEVTHARLDYDVYPEHDAEIDQWYDRWKDHLVNYELVDGCGCCVATYDVQGPRLAIEEFPLAESLVVEWLSDSSH